MSLRRCAAWALARRALPRTPVDGAIEIVVGDEHEWALAGVIVRPCAPLIAHVPPHALGRRGDKHAPCHRDVPAGRARHDLRYRTVVGPGRAAHERRRPGLPGHLPAGLPGDTLHYALAATSAEGLDHHSRI